MVCDDTFNNSSVISWWSVLLEWVVGLWCLKTLSTIFQLYRGGQFYWWRKSEKTIDLPQVNFITYNVVSNTPRHEGIRTHNVSGDRH